MFKSFTKKQNRPSKVSSDFQNYQSQSFLRLSLHTPYLNLQETFPRSRPAFRNILLTLKRGIPMLHSKKMRPAHMANSLTGTKQLARRMPH